MLFGFAKVAIRIKKGKQIGSMAANPEKLDHVCKCVRSLVDELNNGAKTQDEALQALQDMKARHEGGK